MAQVAELNRKRGQAKGFITRAETFVSNIKKDTQLDILMVRMDLLEKAFINFADADSALAFLDQESEMPQIETRFVDVKAILNEQIRSRMSKETLPNKDFNESFSKFTEQQRELIEGIHDRSFIQKEDVRLPPIPIPKFSGKISDFPSFKNLFEVTIHNTSMPKIHKFKYLKGYLTDDAASLLKHVLVTEENYEGAWKKLVNRYDNKQQIVTTLIKQFMNQPTNNGITSRLRGLADVSDEVLRGLEALGDEAKQRDCWLIYLLLEKCDIETKQAWALANDKDYPTIKEFLEFITKRVNSLETVELSDHKKPPHKKAVVLSSVIAKNQHVLYNCDDFAKLSSADRRSLIAEKKLCFSCLRKGHQAVSCRIRSNCKTCGRRHNTLLYASESVQSNAKNTEKFEIEPTSTHINAQLNASVNQSILPTAVVRIQGSGGCSVYCRALLDSGSQVTIIDEELANKLQLTRTNCRIKISGVSTSNVYSRGIATVQISSRFSNSESISTDVLILPRLPVQLPEIKVPIQQLEEIKHLELADPSFSRTSKLNLLIGANAFISSIRDGHKVLGGNMFAIKTIFGYIISGSANVTNHASSFNASVYIDETLRKSWELEQVDLNIETSEENELAEVFFKETMTRSSSGRFIVQLPFKPNRGKLGYSYGIAKKRFMSTERRLTHDPDLKTEYVKFMKEYEDLNHMSRLWHGETITEHSYFLPHHAVVKLSSMTTKVRVVFDGSCKTNSGLSLNDILLCGPVVQSRLWDILLRFKKFKYVMAADIEKMYRQIHIAEPDRQYQQIIWREHPDQEFRRYCLNTVTYGTTSAPFLATRCLKELGLENLKEYPEAGRAIISDFYVDDFLSGADTIEKLKVLKVQVSKILNSAGFELRKWVYNCEMANQPNTDNFKEFDRDSPLKLLGVKWIPSIDAFTFEVQEFGDGDITKRKLLSEASKVFDPLGWLAPSLIISKTIFQELWIKNLDWDDVLPAEIQNKWRKLQTEFQEFRKLQIPRWMGSGEIEIHGFCDASKTAYGAVVYARRIEIDGTVVTNIVTAKTRVASLKTITIPRLELCGALLLAKLLKSVSSSINIPIRTMKAWTDSSVVLAYLSAHPSKWKPFIANRVREIINICPRNIWGYVKSKENPADLCSRGEYPAKLITNDLWWHGPVWLKSPNVVNNFNTDGTDINTFDHINQEMRVSVNLVVNNDDSSVLQTLLDSKSSFSQLIRVVATIFRFISRCRGSKCSKNNIPYLTTSELNHAEMTIIKHVQSVCFGDEIKAIQTNQEISTRSSIKRLSPFLDSDGILRVGGRLKHSVLEYDAKHQILLPKSSNFSKLLMRYIHIKNLHTGTALKFHMSRQKYWVVHGRSIANQITRPYVICRRYKAVSPYQIMGQLPKSRVAGFRAFVNTGIDYAGPISIASKRGRGAKFSKGYIAVFVCTATKAIHLEMVTELTTNAFISCLKRFVSRRGVPDNMYSDNAKNFNGAQKKLKRLASIHDGGMREILQATSSDEFNTEIGKYTATNSITWHFIPPLAPHFGGLWESGVKSVKTHLKKAIGAINLTFEEMSTLLCQIEAVLNSRPLVPQFDNDTSYEAITPGHFLIGSAMTSIPEPFILEGMRVNRIWDEIQLRAIRFWKKFHREYLHTLQQRQKLMNPAENLKISDMVILKDENYPPMSLATRKSHRHASWYGWSHQSCDC